MWGGHSWWRELHEQRPSSWNESVSLRGPGWLDLVLLETRGWKGPFGSEKTWRELTGHIQAHVQTRPRVRTHTDKMHMYISAHAHI